MTSKTPICVIIFDLDQTLINETICKDTLQVLQELKNHQYSLAIASYNKYAKWFCDRYDITKYFDMIEAKFDSTKIHHLKNIMEFYKVPSSKIAFFDDRQRNCNIAQNKLHIKSYKVNKHYGIRLNDIQWLLN